MFKFNAQILTTLPIFLSVNIAALLIYFLDITSQSMPLILGIIAGGLVDLDNSLTGRLKNIFYTLLAFSITTLSVQLLIGKSLPFILMMTILTFATMMLAAVGERYRTIAFGTLVIALYTILTYLPETPWYIDPLMILCGTSLYSFITTLVYLIFPNRLAQETTAKSFEMLADYLNAKAQFFDADNIEDLTQHQINLALKNTAVINAFNACRTALFHRTTNQHRHSQATKLLGFYFVAQDIHERTNSSHFNYQELIENLKHSDLLFRLQRLLELQAQTCTQIAHQLRANKNYIYNQHLERAILGIQQSFSYFSQQIQKQQKSTPHFVLEIKTLVENLQGITQQIQSLANTQDSIQIEKATIYNESISGLRNVFMTIKSQCTLNSLFFRHAVRMAIMVFICCLIGEFTSLERGYWILLTVVFVSQPNYSATKIRLKQRIIGTLLGVLAGAALPYMTATLEAKLAMIVITSTLFYFFRSQNYSFSTFFITLQVLNSFDIMGFNIYDATVPRFIDTLIGAGISWIGIAYLWPDWKYLQLNKTLAQALHSEAQYLNYIIAQLQFGKIDDLKYRIIRRKTHENATALSTTIANMNNEPKKYAQNLSQGMELLRLNYSLLGYISALASFRHTMKNLHQHQDFLACFYPTSKKIILLLENIATISTHSFGEQHRQLEERLNLYKSQHKQYGQEAIPFQQLDLIVKLLPQIHSVLSATTLTKKYNH